VHVIGRVVLNIWRLLRKELKLPNYTLHTCCQQVLHTRIAQYSPLLLARWMKGDAQGHSSVGLKELAVKHVAHAAEANLQLLDAVGIITRTYRPQPPTMMQTGVSLFMAVTVASSAACLESTS
jgi:DNA polymerase zeta